MPQAKWDEAGGRPAKLAALHSPVWAPDAPTTIQTGIEAMTSAVLELLPRK